MSINGNKLQKSGVVPVSKVSGGGGVPYPATLQQYPGMMHHGGMRHSFLRQVAENRRPGSGEK